MVTSPDPPLSPGEHAIRLLIKHAPAKRALSSTFQKLLGPRTHVTLFYGLLSPVLQLTTGSHNLHGGFFVRGDEGWHEAQEALTRLLGEACALRPGQHLLEVGSGIGGAAATMSRTFGCRVTGLNVSRQQIRTARAWIREQGLERTVAFVRGDATRMPFRWPLFHHAFAIESLSHIPDKDAVVREAARVTLPGARFGVLDACAEDFESLRADAEFEAFNAGWGVRGDGWTRPHLLRQAFEHHGFTIEQERDITPQVGPSATVQADYVRRRRALICERYGEEVFDIILGTLEITRRYVRDGLISYRLWVGRKSR